MIVFGVHVVCFNYCLFSSWSHVWKDSQRSHRVWKTLATLTCCQLKSFKYYQLKKIFMYPFNFSIVQRKPELLIDRFLFSKDYIQLFMVNWDHWKWIKKTWKTHVSNIIIPILSKQSIFHKLYNKVSDVSILSTDFFFLHFTT